MSIKIFPAILFSLALILTSCGDGGGNRNTAPPANANVTVSNLNTAVINANSTRNAPAASGQGFSTADACSAPQQVAGDSPLARLGGGTWAKWDTEDGELSYGCEGGLDSVKLEVETAKISAYYTILGGPESINNVSAKYIALQYGGKKPLEEGLRRQYVDFCGKLSRKFYNADLPGKIKDRIAGSLNTVAEKPVEYQEKVGSGMVSLSVVNTKEGMLTLEVRFFPSEGAYDKFKSS